ncbi:type 1 glutamine amidotransferase domain-containing protein [Streptomyces liangshanensis]|uniref:Type 1 glutamine amidotransferase n=1 Tax=Streptomyces liangshanensis TaxID=2717324 RepID=A0A6G9GSU9_9ACTN|nr:type 1 glutamine amidotransferase domain-containing protein [Streptomyces liangshanensis]QIQ01295.1 type 1 glutamine amidotransferase [Streptomyces liangshanensis]
MRVAFLVAPEGVERVELTEPWQAVGDAGGERVLISTEPGEIQSFDHLDKAASFPVDLTVAEASAADYDGLVLPGGVANADDLRTDAGAVAFAKSFFDAGKPVAAICHASWTLVEAGVLRGRTLTSWPSLRTDLRNAGATWVDEQVHVCTSGPNTLITSRNPGDLKAFNATFVPAFGG